MEANNQPPESREPRPVGEIVPEVLEAIEAREAQRALMDEQQKLFGNPDPRAQERLKEITDELLEAQRKSEELDQ